MAVKKNKIRENVISFIFITIAVMFFDYLDSGPLTSNLLRWWNSFD